VKLYVGALSLFSAKARIAFAEKGVEPELVTVGWSRQARYEPHHPDVVALNPKRQVPVLVDGEVVVYDSTQIFEYLEERLPEPPLYPSDLTDRARCRRLEAAGDEIWFPRVWELIEQRFYPAAASDPKLVERATRGLESLHRELEKELVASDFLVGSEVTVADISVFIQQHTAGVLGVPAPEDCSAVRRWADRISKRPSVAPILTDMMTAAAKAMAS
jgi:glutathione S-transferase